MTTTSDSFELSKKFKALKDSLKEEEESPINPISKTFQSPVFGLSNGEKTLRDYIYHSKEKTYNSTKQDSDESNPYDIEKLRLEKKITSLFAKDRRTLSSSYAENSFKNRNCETDYGIICPNVLENKITHKEKELNHFLTLESQSEKEENLINELNKEKIKNFDIDNDNKKKIKELENKLNNKSIEKKQNENFSEKKITEILNELKKEREEKKMLEFELNENKNREMQYKKCIELEISTLKEEISNLKIPKKDKSTKESLTDQLKRIEKLEEENLYLRKNKENTSSAKYLKLKNQVLQLKSENDDLYKKLEKSGNENLIISDLREELNIINKKNNDLTKENYDLKEKLKWLELQLKEIKENAPSRPNDEILIDKIDVLEKKNTKLNSQNKLLKQMIKSSSGKYIELIRNLKKKLKETNQILVQETAIFENYKESISAEVKCFIEKEKNIYLNKIKYLKEEILDKVKYINILEKLKK